MLLTNKSSSPSRTMKQCKTASATQIWQRIEPLQMISKMANPITPLKSLLTIGLYKHLHGSPMTEAVNEDWAAKVSPSIREQYDNVGFDLDPTNMPQNLDDLRQTLRSRGWDGITIGWCTRGNLERTELFEQVVDLCVEATSSGADGSRAKKRTKLMFSKGPDDLAATAMRNFSSA